MIETGRRVAGFCSEQLDVKHPDMKPPRSKKVPTGAGAGKTPLAAPFDLWLQRGLHQMFDDVAKEPIPDELLKLIEDDRKK
ncbi:MAG: NepR family anti-sigma factor [Acetobacteraceae bacterium]